MAAAAIALITARAIVLTTTAAIALITARAIVFITETIITAAASSTGQTIIDLVIIMIINIMMMNTNKIAVFLRFGIYS